jgi:hypothetical protein
MASCRLIMPMWWSGKSCTVCKSGQWVSVICSSRWVAPNVKKLLTVDWEAHSKQISWTGGEGRSDPPNAGQGDLPPILCANHTRVDGLSYYSAHSNSQSQDIFWQIWAFCY